jgi:hypothetical protein
MEPTLICNSMDLLGQPHLAAFRSKLNEIIEYSTYSFEKRSSLINIELDGLRKDYQSQILKLNDFLNNPNLTTLSNMSAPSNTTLCSSIISRSKSPICSGSRNGQNTNKTIVTTKSNKVSKEKFFTSHQSGNMAVSQSPIKNVKISPSSFSKDIMGGVHGINNQSTNYSNNLLNSNSTSNGLKVKNGATKKSHQDALTHVLSNNISSTQKNRRFSPLNAVSSINNLNATNNEKEKDHSINNSFNQISQSHMQVSHNSTTGNIKNLSNPLMNSLKNSSNLLGGTNFQNNYQINSTLINRHGNTSKYLQPGHHKTSSMSSISSAYSNYHHLGSEKKPISKKGSNSEIIQNGTLKYKTSVSQYKEKILEPLKPNDSLNMNSNLENNYDLNMKSLSNSQSMSKINSIADMSNPISRQDNSRKFSILDIESSKNNFILIHNNNNESFISKSNKVDGVQTLLPDGSSELGMTININENNIHSISGENFLNDYNSMRSKGLTDRYSMAFYTLAASQ